MYQANDRNRNSGDQAVQSNVNYFTEKFFNGEKLNPNWVGENAQKLSQGLANQGNNAMGATAMRNFYNEFLRIKALPASKKDEKLIFVKLIKAKTNYKTFVQQGSTINRLFADFVCKLVDEVGDDVDKFDKACYVFEAVIGYSNKK